MKIVQLAVFTLCAATLCSVPTVRAETVVPSTTQPPFLVDLSQTVSLPLRNIKPSIMAFWLDPQHTAIAPNQELPLQASPQLAVLPDGIDTLTAKDDTLELVARGTKEGIEQLRQTIALLDKPIPQIEIEMQLVEVQKTLVSTNGFAKKLSSNPDIAAFDGQGIVKLIAAGKAKIAQAPRVTTFNKMHAVIMSMQSNTLFAGPFDTEGKSKRSITIGIGQRLSVTPTLNRDNTIALDLDCVDGFFQNDSPRARNITPLSSLSNRTIQTIINVNSGETVALFNEKEQDNFDSAWVLLVKASPFSSQDGTSHNH